MGLDYGAKRIGIAVCNYEQSIASPVENYTRNDPATDARILQQFGEDYTVVGLVVGLPVHMSGEEGEQARRAREFGNWLSETIGLPLRFWDERYTSAIAESHLLSADLSRKKRKARIDMLASQVMLQAYLDAPDRAKPPSSM